MRERGTTFAALRPVAGVLVALVCGRFHGRDREGARECEGEPSGARGVHECGREHGEPVGARRTPSDGLGPEASA